MKNTLAQINQTITLNNWLNVNRNLVAKILTEFMYEDLLVTKIEPLQNSTFQHSLKLENGIEYRFIAESRIFGNWQIDKDSISYYRQGIEQDELLVSEFIRNSYQKIGIDELTLGHLLRELNHTLIADCHILNTSDNANSHLLNIRQASQIEGYMRGHPWFVINKGRLGFSYEEYLSSAPEMRNLQKLAWLAVRKNKVTFNAIDDLNYQQLIIQELAEEDINKFQQLLNSHNLIAQEYYLMPIHNWQWQRQIIQLFPEDIARNNIVYLGHSSDDYLATQSIRSFNNQSDYRKFQVKLPLSIFNTAVYRGLPHERTELAPLLTQWLKDIHEQDSFFHQETRLIMLGEIASISYAHPIYNQIEGVPYQYQELLGVIWRENVNNYLEESEFVMSMAALIHLDKNNEPLVIELIKRSGLTIAEWLEQLFAVCLPPLLHWLYKYGVAFSPHGENTMLVMDENYQPKALVLKDFIDDVNLSEQNIELLKTLPAKLQNTLYRLSNEDMAQFIQTGLFVVLYRYLSDILLTHAGYSEAQFWQQVHTEIEKYHQNHPELSEQIQGINLFKPQFKKLNLNRLRLIEVGYADYNQRPKVESRVMMNNPVSYEIWSKDASLKASNGAKINV